MPNKKSIMYQKRLLTKFGRNSPRDASTEQASLTDYVSHLVTLAQDSPTEKFRFSIDFIISMYPIWLISKWGRQIASPIYKRKENSNRKSLQYSSADRLVPCRKESLVSKIPREASSWSQSDGGSNNNWILYSKGQDQRFTFWSKWKSTCCVLFR